MAKRRRSEGKKKVYQWLKKCKIMSPSLYEQGSNYLKKLKTQNKAVRENTRRPVGEDKRWEVTEAERDTKREVGNAFSIIPV